ncbi:hypothetical protein BJ508DRAFT_197565, partial [Ascobolus immersus RN42]
PVILASDTTHLSVGSGCHKFWPLYISIGNIPSSIRNKPSNNAWILLAQIPIPPSMRTYDKTKNGPRTEWVQRYQDHKDEALRVVINAIFEPIKESAKTGMQVLCADGTRRLGFPEVAAWIANFQEYNKLYTTKAHGCCLCEVN